ncbi:thioredoxin domain-containing protein [Metabacillus fastidiosus]|uniref:DsbA family protein n=1 Tax=Metabacillus fastidiosus TaxID=1458 RepID=UPI002E1E776E|nr:thioredoxin domain-containing protein [Metabacillus fastidiosus]
MKKIIAIISVTFLFGILFYHFALKPEAEIAVEANKKVDMSIINPKIGTTMGNTNAPVSIFIYSDYGCLACKELNQQLDEIGFRGEYLEKGIIKVIYKDIPPSEHINSDLASMAALAANEQGRFWEMHALLFENSSWVEDKEKLFSYAQKVNLDMNKFKSDLESTQLRALIDENIKESKHLGLMGTPVMIINNKIILGTPSSSEKLKEIIDNAIKESNAVKNTALNNILTNYLGGNYYENIRKTINC